MQVWFIPLVKHVGGMYKCSAVAEMGDRLATVDIWPKIGGCAPLGELGPHLA